MTIRATIHTWVGYVDTLTGDFINPNNATVTVDGIDTSQVLTASSTPPATKATQFSQAMTAGAATIDLTAVPNEDESGTIDGTGLKVQAAKFFNPATNANAITITFGASNPHLLAGAAWKLILQPGQGWTFSNEGVDVGVDVDGTHKTWDISGTLAQALDVGIIFG